MLDRHRHDMENTNIETDMKTNNDCLNMFSFYVTRMTGKLSKRVESSTSYDVNQKLKFMTHVSDLLSAANYVNLMWEKLERELDKVGLGHAEPDQNVLRPDYSTDDDHDDDVDDVPIEMGSKRKKKTTKKEQKQNNLKKNKRPKAAEHDPSKNKKNKAKTSQLSADETVANHVAVDTVH